MKFFIPRMPDASEAEKLYSSICQFNREQMTAKLSNQRIYRVEGVHDGEPFSATVGEPFESLGETVMAILFDASRKVYFICTLNRGVLLGIPYLSGSEEIRSIEEFEA